MLLRLIFADWQHGRGVGWGYGGGGSERKEKRLTEVVDLVQNIKSHAITHTPPSSRPENLEHEL